MIAFHLDTSGVVEALRKQAARVRGSLERAMELAGKDFMEWILEDQLSGRKADNTALYRRTRNLYFSIRSNVSIAKGKVENTITNSGADYWWYHQKGTKHLPKRLFIWEEWDNTAEALYSSMVEQALGGAYQK